MPQEIREFVDSRGQTLRHDPHASVLRGVKLLGLASRNKRTYKESALRDAIPLYEGARVNVNHASGDPLGPRDYRDRLGVVRNVEMRSGEGLFGTLHFNPKHPIAEQLTWDAEHSPENVGLSHNVLANTRRDGAEVVVESIVHVQSVDLVADPATTKGLFEHTEIQSEPSERFKQWEDLTLEQVELHRPDLLASLAEQHQARVEELKQKAQQLEEQVASANRREEVLDLLREHGLCNPGGDQESASVGPELIRTLQELHDADERRRLVSEHAKLVRESRFPKANSREQQLESEATSAPSAGLDEFLEAVKGHR